jgi:SHS2 domain-containing protein
MRAISKIPDFEEIPHKADAAINVFGFSISDLFIHAVQGMYFIMGIEEKGDHNSEDTISLQDSSLESLMVSFLTEILFLVEKGFKADVIELEIKDNFLQARIKKNPLSGIAKEIKAVTFNEMKIIKKNNVFQTKIVFDI